MNTWQDLEVENLVIRPINIKKFDFSNPIFVDEFDTITAELTYTDDNGNVETEKTPPTPLNVRGTVTHCLKFEMKSDLGEEMGVGVIFCMKPK